MNTLYYGDNLYILREHNVDESIDLIYLDPPFNLKRVYNVYLKTPMGHTSDAQIGLFVTLANPTEPMKREAVSAGFYD